MKIGTISYKILGYVFWVYLLALFLLTVFPIHQVDSLIFQSSHSPWAIRLDYILHVLVYLPLPVLMGYSIENRQKRSGKARIMIVIRVVFFSLVVASGFETLQLLLEYRTFNINDLAGNTGGVIAGTILYIFHTFQNSRVLGVISRSMENHSSKSPCLAYEKFCPYRSRRFYCSPSYVGHKRYR